LLIGRVSPKKARPFQRVPVIAVAIALSEEYDRFSNRNPFLSMNTNWFATMAQSTARAAGSSSAFIAICGITLVWMVTGPVFHWSDTWQLVINTVTNIVSMLMVFLIQNTQNRESSALQLKIDELLRAVRGAQNAFINLEDLNEEDLNRLKKRYAAIAVSARENPDLSSPDIEPASGTPPTSSE
jgi:low affinity Fe/Cu permease